MRVKGPLGAAHGNPDLMSNTTMPASPDTMAPLPLEMAILALTVAIFITGFHIIDSLVEGIVECKSLIKQRFRYPDDTEDTSFPACLLYFFLVLAGYLMDLSRGGNTRMCVIILYGLSMIAGPLLLVLMAQGLYLGCVSRRFGQCPTSWRRRTSRSSMKRWEVLENEAPPAYSTLAVEERDLQSKQGVAVRKYPARSMPTLEAIAYVGTF